MKGGLSLAVLTLLTPMLWGSDSLRGNPVGPLLPDQPPREFRLDDLLDIPLPEPSPLYRALVVIVSIPRDILPFRQSFAVVLATNLRPRYRPDFRDYLADRLGSQILPLSQAMTIRIPLQAQTRLEALRNSWDLPSPPPTSGNLALVITPIDKDLPPNAQSIRFTAVASLLPGSHGAARVGLPELNPPELENVKLGWLGKQYPWQEVVYLPPGRGELEILDSPLRYEPIPVEIVAGRIQQLTFRPQETEAYFVWDVPTDARVEVNGTPVSLGQPHRIPFGVNRIVLRLGSSTLSRVIEVTRPGRYLVSLDLELKIDGH